MRTLFKPGTASARITATRITALLTILLAFIFSFAPTASAQPESSDKAPGHFKRWSVAINNLITAELGLNRVEWFDDRHIITSLPVPESLNHPLRTVVERVVLIDLETGNTKTSPYRGRLVCYAPGQMFVERPTDGSDLHTISPRTSPVGHMFAAGPYGKTLRPVAGERHSVEALGCQPVVPPRQPELAGYNVQPFPSDWGRLLWRQVDSTMRYRYIGKGKTDVQFDLPVGEYVDLTRLAELPWKKAFFLPVAIAEYLAPQAELNQLLLHSDGKLETIAPPDKLLDLVRNGAGTVQAYYSRAGTIWAYGEYEATSGYPNAGLYMELDGKLVRVASGPFEARTARVSPNGCRLFYGVRNKDRHRIKSDAWKQQHQVIDFCTLAESKAPDKQAASRWKVHYSPTHETARFANHHARQ